MLEKIPPNYENYTVPKNFAWHLPPGTCLAPFCCTCKENGDLLPKLPNE